MNDEPALPPVVDLAPPPVQDIRPVDDFELRNAARLHPLSLLFEFSHRVRTNLIPAIFASFSAATGGIVGLYIGVGIFGIAIAFAIVRYLTFRYRLTADHLLIDSGLVFRTHRSVPIDRIQNIDSVQNLFHRFFKVAEVRIETASGNEPEATMRVISMTEVESLRQNLARLSAARALRSNTESLQAHVTSPTLDAPHSASTPHTACATDMPTITVAADPHETILTIPTSQLIRAGLISNRGQVLAGLVLGYFWQASARNSKWEELADDQSPIRFWIGWSIKQVGLVSQSFGWVGNQLLTAVIVVIAALLIILALRVFSVIWFVLKFYDYQLTRRGRDFNIQCGLLTKVSATVPADRIQVICVHRTWLARWLNLASIRIEASGGSAKEEDDASATVARTWFVPVMSAQELPRVLNALQPGLDLDIQTLNWRPLAPRAFARMIRLPLAVFGLVFLIGLGLGIWLSWITAAIPTIVGALGWISTLLVARKRAKSRKFAQTEQGFIYRSGTLTQKTSYGFWNRTQSLCLKESPFDRRWHMATLLIDTAGVGTADHLLSIEYLSIDTARAEFETAARKLCP